MHGIDTFYIKLENVDTKIDVFLTVHHSILVDLSKYQLSAHSLNIQQYKLHYTPQHVSSSVQEDQLYHHSLWYRRPL